MNGEDGDDCKWSSYSIATYSTCFVLWQGPKSAAGKSAKMIPSPPTFYSTHQWYQGKVRLPYQKDKQAKWEGNMLEPTDPLSPSPTLYQSQYHSSLIPWLARLASMPEQLASRLSGKDRLINMVSWGWRPLRVRKVHYGEKYQSLMNLNYL